jgi:hypothetical protein
VPGRAICQTRTTPLCRETQASLKPSVACRLEFHHKAERRGAFRHPEACLCHPLRILTLASMAVRCAGSAAFITSAAAIVSVAAEDTAIDEDARRFQMGRRLDLESEPARPARSLQ